MLEKYVEEQNLVTTVLKKSLKTCTGIFILIR